MATGAGLGWLVPAGRHVERGTSPGVFDGRVEASYRVGVRFVVEHVALAQRGKLAAQQVSVAGVGQRFTVQRRGEHGGQPLLHIHAPQCALRPARLDARCLGWSVAVGHGFAGAEADGYRRRSRFYRHASRVPVGDVGLREVA